MEAAKNSAATFGGYINGGDIRARDGGTVVLSGTLTNANLYTANGGLISLSGLLNNDVSAGSLSITPQQQHL